MTALDQIGGPISATDQELLRRAGGFKEKPPNTSIQLIRQETFMVRDDEQPPINIFRVLCTECITQFDVLGTMAAADAMGECSVIQRCLEHLANCQLKTKPAETFVIQNKLSPEFFKFTVTWA